MRIRGIDDSKRSLVRVSAAAVRSGCRTAGERDYRVAGPLDASIRASALAPDEVPHLSPDTILSHEPGSSRFANALNEAESPQMSAASVLEVGILVESRYGQVARDGFARWLEDAGREGLIQTAPPGMNRLKR